MDISVLTHTLGAYCYFLYDSALQPVITQSSCQRPGAGVVRYMGGRGSALYGGAGVVRHMGVAGVVRYMGGRGSALYGGQG